jgi:acetyl esterase
MRLDPDAELLRQALLVAAMPALETLTPPAAREMLAAARRRAGVTGPELASVSDLDAGGVRARLYRPTDGVLPVVLFLHGGGWVLGDLDSHDALARHVAAASGAAVLAVDYRLAPEHRFPAAVDDAAAALRWLATEAHTLGLDGSRIAVMGDSAGGNLAAVLALMARDGDVPPIRVQVLAYPVTEVTLEQASHALSGVGVTLTGAGMRWFRDHYLGTASADWRAAPLRADLAGVAPALVLTAGIDPLCDEGIAYAARLAMAGVQLEHRHYPGQMHGFLTAGLKLPTAQTEIARIGQALAAVFERRS